MKDKTYKRTDSAVFHQTENEAYLLDQEGDEVVTLNETGALVWSLLEKPRTLEEMVTSVSGRYESNQDMIAKDIRKLLDFLLKKGFITHG